MDIADPEHRHPTAATGDASPSPDITAGCDHRTLIHLPQSSLWLCPRCGRELWLDEWFAMTEGRRDPRPWKHVDGTRVDDIASVTSPKGGYTYRPRAGFPDHTGRRISALVSCQSPSGAKTA